jgi:hypothetical protein
MKKEEARHLEGIVNDLLHKWQTRKIKKASAVKEAWEKAADTNSGGRAELISYKNGVLTVVVENSSLLYKLTLEKREILKKFNEQYKGRKKAQNIRFRVGTTDP